MLFWGQSLNKKQSFLSERLPRFCTQDRMLSAFALRKKHPPTITIPVRPAFDGEAARRLRCSQASPSLGFVAACAARAESWLGSVDGADVVKAAAPQSSQDMMEWSEVPVMRAKRSSDEMMASDAAASTGMEMGALTKVQRHGEKLIRDESTAPMCIDSPQDAVGVDQAVLAMQKWLGCVSLV